LVLANGMYNLSSTLVLSDEHRWFIGNGATRPTLRTAQGNVVNVTGGSNVTLEYLDVSGTAANANPGAGVPCGERGVGGTRSMQLIDSVITHNTGCGVVIINCGFSILRSTLEANHDGVCTTDSSGTIDRVLATGNTSYGAALDGGEYTVTNSFFVRN